MTDRTSIEAVTDLLLRLSAAKQQEVQDFIEFLLQKSQETALQDESMWSSFSLSNAMRGMEDESDLYSENDLQETWT